MTHFRFRYKRMGYMRWRCRRASRQAKLHVLPGGLNAPCAPTQNDQYIRLDVGRAILLGNVRNGFRGYTTALATQLPGILAPTRTVDLATYEYSGTGPEAGRSEQLRSGLPRPVRQKAVRGR